MKRSTERIAFAVALALLLIVAWRALIFYYSNGIYWDFISHYINGQSIDNPGFLSNMHLYGSNTLVENHGIYFEVGRAPLSEVAFALLIPVFSSISIPIYIIIELLLLFVGCMMISKQLRQNQLILLSLVLVPYLIAFLVLGDSEDLLSLAIMTVAIGFLLKKSRYFGLALGLAALAKYTSLAFLPLILLEGDMKSAIEAMALFLIVTAPWLLFNAYFFGIPSYSYVVQFNMNFAANSTFVIFWVGLLEQFYLPILVLALLCLALLFYKKPDLGSIEKSFRKHREAIVAMLAFLILSFVVLIATAKGQGLFAEARYGAFFYLALSVVCSFAIAKVSNRLNISGITPFALAGVSAILLVFLFYANISAATAQLQYSTFNPYFQTLISQMKASGIVHGPVVSNFWVYLIYYNITAYPPYYFNATVDQYPIVIDKDFGVEDYLINSTCYRLEYTKNLTIYVPDNSIAGCG